MNVYLVTEGPVGEKQIYSCWAPLANPSLRVIRSIDEITQDCIFIVSGGGYPGYFEVIENAAKDVAAIPAFDRLIVAIDSEEQTYAEKFAEIDGFIGGLGLGVNYRIVVQHFCLETWALGNRAIVSRKPKNQKVREYLSLFDVLRLDPELLPGKRDEGLNRAQFAEKYLRRLLNEKFRNLTYTKSNPGALLHKKYYEQVHSRLVDTGHIGSFDGFVNAFN